jgi:sodium-dependent dicarboxylate transporter 2/3/5
MSRFGVETGFLDSMVDDSTIAVGMALLLFVLPGEREQGKPTYLLSWNHAERVLPWGMLLLIGSGFAMADAFKVTRLADWMGLGLAQALQGQSLWVLVLGVCLMVTFLTEFTTNVATVNALLPTLGAMALELNIDPRLLLIPATVTASCSFMLPVGTPPNAIVFATGRVPIRAMMIYGLLLNLFGVVAVTAIMLLWGTWVMGI